jgi:DNA-binding MarR family transcriptional regulator
MKKESLRLIHLKGYRWITKRIFEKLENDGIKNYPKPTVMLFSYIPEEGIRPSELARFAYVSRQAVLKSLKLLLADSLITMEDDTKYKNGKIVRLSEKGEQLYAKGLKAVEEIEEELAQIVGREKVDLLKSTLIDVWSFVS